MDSVNDLLPHGVKWAVLLCVQALPTGLLADQAGMGWGAEIYGGRYYEDDRAGAYLVLSKEVHGGPTLIGEGLLERYPDYDFGGLGAHVLWPVGVIGEIGIVASQSWETYEFAGGAETDYETRVLGGEWEFSLGQFAVAAQYGKYLKDYSGAEPEYFSADVYYWGTAYEWYLRAATRRISGASLNLVELYRDFHVDQRSITAYAGLSSDELTLVSPGRKDSIYVGAYADLLSRPDSSWTLWVEAAAEESDMLFTIEFNVSFGPGSRTPYITAFGFSLDD